MQKKSSRPNKRERAPRRVWSGAEPLFPPLMPFAARALEILPRALAKVWPLNKAHSASLPDDIAELSSLLTQDRSQLRHSYWSKPNFVSAYLYYFLPWNILRQCRLLQDLPLPPFHTDGQNWLLDAGSGSLSLPIALWLARQDLREKKLKILALDKSRRPMELGRAIFESLAELAGLQAWPVSLVKGSFEKAANSLPDGKIWLFSAANVLNEIVSGRRQGKRFKSQEFMAEDNENDLQLEPYFDAIPAFMENGAAFLSIEPGTRLGGECMMHLREFAVANGYCAHSPCAHQEKCPLLARNRQQATNNHSSLGSAWCHFTFDTSGAPVWLLELSRKAGLDKKSLSLSPLLLSATVPVDKGQPGKCRIISRPFPVPNLSEYCRYGCEKNGLAILPDAKWLEDGALVPFSRPAKPEKDKKSGAVIVEPPVVADVK